MNDYSDWIKNEQKLNEPQFAMFKKGGKTTLKKKGRKKIRVSDQRYSSRVSIRIGDLEKKEKKQNAPQPSIISYPTSFIDANRYRGMAVDLPNKLTSEKVGESSLLKNIMDEFKKLKGDKPVEQVVSSSSDSVSIKNPDLPFGLDEKDVKRREKVIKYAPISESGSSVAEQSISRGDLEDLLSQGRIAFETSSRDKTLLKKAREAGLL